MRMVEFTALPWYRRMPITWQMYLPSTLVADGNALDAFAYVLLRHRWEVCGDVVAFVTCLEVHCRI
jgi:hypothetical protein